MIWIIIHFFLYWTVPTLSQSVGIVGAGIGGASTSYFLRKFSNNLVPITAFESNDYIGGRLREINYQGNIIEIGGDAFASENYYLVQFTNELAFNFTPNGDDNVTVGIWDGSQMFTVDYWKDLISELELYLEIERFKIQLSLNYEIRDHYSGPFKTVDEFLSFGNLEDFTSQASKDFAQYHHIEEDVAKMDWEPITRVIYDQSISIQAFAGIVSLLPLFSDNYSILGGNSLMPKTMFSQSQSTVYLNTTITDITLLPGGDFLLETSLGNSYIFKYVVIAAPLEHTGITFHNISLPFIQPRIWKFWYITIVIAESLNPVYFNRTAQNMPDSILTLENSTSPFVSIELQDTTRDGFGIYKISGNEALDMGIIEKIFIGVKYTYGHYWKYTFPILDPLKSGESYQPVVLGENLFYLSGIESTATAMECSVISGRNVAQLIANLIK